MKIIKNANKAFLVGKPEEIKNMLKKLAQELPPGADDSYQKLLMELDRVFRTMFNKETPVQVKDAVEEAELSGELTDNHGLEGHQEPNEDIIEIPEDFDLNNNINNDENIQQFAKSRGKIIKNNNSNASFIESLLKRIQK